AASKSSKVEPVMRTDVESDRLLLKPLSPADAAALGNDRMAAERLIRAKLPIEWPHPDLLPLLTRQAASSRSEAEFGIWLIIERDAATVAGEAGFKGSPARRRVGSGRTLI